MLRRLFASLLLCLPLVAVLPAAPVQAATSTATSTTDCSSGSIIPQPDCRGDVTQKRVSGSTWQSLYLAGNLDTTLNTLADRILNVVYVLLGGIAVIMLIWSGIQYIMAGGGQADSAKKARQNITNVLVGIVLLVASYGIINLAVNFSLYFAR